MDKNIELHLFWGTIVAVRDVVPMQGKKVRVCYDVVRRGRMSKLQIKKCTQRLLEHSVRCALEQHPTSSGTGFSDLECKNHRKSRDERWLRRYIGLRKS